MHLLEKLTELSLKSFPVDHNDTPDTAVTTLPRLTTPLPSAEDTTRIEFPTSEWNVDREAMQPPAAPMMKDLDSFTDGTGKGSLESILDEAPNERGDLMYHPDESLGFIPELDPSISHSIEMWREEVSGYDASAPSLGVADLPEDPIEREAMEAAESLLDGVKLDNEPRIMPVFNNVSMGSAPLTATTPRVMKRARSRSPTSQCSRRIRRARSKSLSSICGLANSSWHAKTESYKRPFD
ncbi:hypothetical protein D9615_006068 [Tricholomella constricta]|uniref:Uncharacterized protein n=1 Tax=Tricholomella constricta TaxID=117010 RepID=A0A8H5H8Z7_9AGAR|nr:hypothetical protein D9615_006068 [Tricholomella constricta]